jgi:hypothetical protein
MADAESHIARIDPANVAPIKSPVSWLWGLVLTVVAVAASLLSPPTTDVIGAVLPNDVVIAQAARLAESFEELEKFNEEESDPEIEELIKELAASVEEMREPGVDTREALAKLSEMELALQQKQRELLEQNASAVLAEIGEALSLAEQFAAAGEAMSAGDMEKAAAELAKLELPEIDRKTERAMIEKLEQAQNDGDGTHQNLRKAAGEISQGLTLRDRGRFREGVEGLAGECRNQGRRTKLADLLRRQCQCLGECKGECAGQPTNKDGKGKGGKNWGLGRSGNEPGEQTPKLATNTELKVTGQESDEGNVDTETLSAPDQQQEAVRQYRAAAERYEQISESVLSSEPIPLGHRQTIRRYFEMIRPQGTETDMVQERMAQ